LAIPSKILLKWKELGQLTVEKINENNKIDSDDKLIFKT
jgi:hypothetical protein